MGSNVLEALLHGPQDESVSRREETGLPPASGFPPTENRILTNDRDWELSDKQSRRWVKAQRVSLQLV